MIRKKYDLLDVFIYSDREEMGKNSAKVTIKEIVNLLEIQPEVNIIFAAAASQIDFFNHLIESKDIDWSRVNAYHMDEYIGLPNNHPSLFSNFLKENLFNKISFNNIYYINSTSEPQKESIRYAQLLNSVDIDIVIMGIGENGHIAFNDPAIANFDDPLDVKIVELDEVSRSQQVNDGAFKNIEEVPKQAITLTIPRLLKAKKLQCIVPTERKAEAVYRALKGPITESCPASILRTKNNCMLHIDAEAASLLER